MSRGLAGSASIFWRRRRDVYVYRAVRYGPVMSPNSIQKLLTAQHHARTIHQKLEAGGIQSR